MQRFYKILGILIMLSLSTKAQVRYLDEVFDSVTVTSDIVYGNATNASNTSQDVKLDIYMPHNDIVTNRPVILWAHGGSFVGGSKDNAEIVPFAQRFAKRGFVCISIQYRLGLDSFPPNQPIVLRSMIRAVQDGKAAVRFVRANAATYGIDTTHIFFGGSSAGAITALHIGYLSNLQEFQQEADSSMVIGLGGLEGGNNGSPGYSSKIHGVINLCGALGEKTWIEPGDIPLASVHGDADDVVPYGTAEIKFQGLPLGLTVDGSYVIDSFANTISVQSALKTFYGQGHVPYVNNATYLDSTINFLAPHVYSWLGIQTSNEKSLNTLSASVYPNPVYNKLNIPLPTSTTANLQIFDLHGQEIYQSKINQRTSIDVSDWANGIYLIRLQSGDLISTKKLIKK